jgi:predicted nucleic acid-binding protein
MKTPVTAKFAALIPSGRIIVGDLVLLELLQGCRDDAHAARLERDLRSFPVVPLFSDDLATLAAQNYRKLRKLGITIRKTVDLVIGTYCLEHGHHLLHADRDFDPMAAHLGLMVA